MRAAATIMVQAKKVSKELEGIYHATPPGVGGTIVKAPARRTCEITSDRYAVAANMAECLNPAPKLPSLILPMKNPEIQHCNMMPTENIRICPCIAINATLERLVLTTVVIM